MRQGFSVVGVEIGPELVGIARKDAAEQGLEAEFIQGDLRVLELEDEFDVVLNLNDGAMERVFHGNSRPKEPTEAQFEIFAAARKG